LEKENIRKRLNEISELMASGEKNPFEIKEMMK